MRERCCPAPTVGLASAKTRMTIRTMPSTDGQVWGKALASHNLERRGELLEEDVDEEEEEQKKE